MPATISLKMGGVGTVDLKIANDSQRAIHILSHKSGCDCMTIPIPLGGLVVPPRTTSTVRATVDLRSDPTNPRSFAPEVEFFGEGFASPLVAKVEVEVQAP